MTHVDLHPEELLERARIGAATPDELARVQAHLEQCTVCRVEHELLEHSQREGEPLDQEELIAARVKRRVLSQLSDGHRRPARRWLSTTALTAIALTIASGATAALLVERARRQAEEAEPKPVAVEAKKPAPSKPWRASQSARIEEPQEEEEAVEEPEPTAKPTPAPAAKPAAPEKSTHSSAGSLFKEANQARRQGDTKKAASLYRQLQAQFPGSGEEVVSRVTLGRLLLDRLGDAGGALVQFNSYLANPSQGALREEALVGRALSLHRLGRGAEELNAWKALLRSFPRSTYRARANDRIEALGGSDSRSASPKKPSATKH